MTPTKEMPLDELKGVNGWLLAHGPDSARLICENEISDDDWSSQ